MSFGKVSAYISILHHFLNIWRNLHVNLEVLLTIKEFNKQTNKQIKITLYESVLSREEFGDLLEVTFYR